MNELTITTNSINELSNGALRKECRNYLTAINGISKSRWKCARTISNIVNGEYFADDFKSKRDFYAFIGLKESNGSQLIAAQSLNEEYELNDILSVGKCYAISTLGGDAGEFIKTYTLDELMSMSDKAVVNAVKEWRAIDENGVVDDNYDTDISNDSEQESEAQDEQESEEQDVEIEDTDIERGCIEILNLMKSYGVTLAILEQYITRKGGSNAQ